MCYLVLNVPEETPEPDAALESELAEQGIRFSGTSLEAVDDTLLDRLVELSATAQALWLPYYDEPSIGATGPELRGYLEGGAGLPECIFLAWKDHRLIGFSNVRQGTAEPDELYQSLTAVHPEFAGLGIGQALKARVVRLAVAQGFKEISTYNRADNGPMLHINEKFGFRRVSEEHRLVKQPGQQRAPARGAPTGGRRDAAG